jgi:hypothetical protein
MAASSPSTSRKPPNMPNAEAGVVMYPINPDEQGSLEKHLLIHFLPFYCGDMIIIQIPQGPPPGAGSPPAGGAAPEIAYKNLLIDCSRYPRTKYSMKQFINIQLRIKQIHYIIITHPHADHCRGMSDLFDDFCFETPLDEGRKKKLHSFLYETAVPSKGTKDEGESKKVATTKDDFKLVVERIFLPTTGKRQTNTIYQKFVKYLDALKGKGIGTDVVVYPSEGETVLAGLGGNGEFKLTFMGPDIEFVSKLLNLDAKDKEKEGAAAGEGDEGSAGPTGGKDIGDAEEIAEDDEDEDVEKEAKEEMAREKDDFNNVSLVFKIEWGKNIFLFPGDAEEELWQYLFSSGRSLEELIKNLKLLKMAHHGAANGTPENILDRINFAVNSFVVATRHPSNGRIQNKTIRDLYPNYDTVRRLWTANQKTPGRIRNRDQVHAIDHDRYVIFKNNYPFLYTYHCNHDPLIETSLWAIRFFDVKSGAELSEDLYEKIEGSDRFYKFKGKMVFNNESGDFIKLEHVKRVKSVPHVKVMLTWLNSQLDLI